MVSARKPRPVRRSRRVRARAGLGTLRARIVALLTVRERPRRFAEIASAPGVAAFRQPTVWRALATLTAGGAVRWGCSARLGERWGFPVGLLFPVFWAPRWSFPHLRAEPRPAPGGRGGRHV